MSDYNIKLGIDSSGGLTEIDEMIAGIGVLESSAKKASVSISQVLTDSAKSGDTLVSKMNAGAAAAKNLQDAAAKAGSDIGKAFAPANINTQPLSDKVAVFVAKLHDVIGQPINFKFNIDQAGIDLLVGKLKDAGNEMEGFELVLAQAKTRLNDLVKGSDPFNALNLQIQEAEKFLNVLKEDVIEVQEVIATPVAAPAIEAVGDAAEAAAPKTQSLRLQLRQMREELAQLELAGQGGTEEFRALSIAAGELQDQIGDTSQRIQRLASDTKGLDAGIAAVRGLAGAFAIGQGALAAFGEQNEEAAKAIQKVQGAMAILQGIQEVANVLNKDSALSVYLQTFASGEHTAAVAAETVAIETETVATEAATTATEAWTVALLANPITAIIAVLAVAALAVYEFAKSQKSAALSADEFNKVLQQQEKFLQEDLARIDNRNKVSQAALEAEKKNQSALTQLQIQALNSRKLVDQLEIEEIIRYLAQLDRTDKNYLEARKTALDKIDALEQDKRNLTAEGTAGEIKLQQQFKDESAKLYADQLKEREANYVALVAIEKAAKDYSAEIVNLRIADLKDGQQKELSQLRTGLSDRLRAIDEEHKAALNGLQNTRADLQASYSLADENGKKLIQLQLSDNAKQIAAQTANGAKLKDLTAKLKDSELVAEQKVIKKYADEQADIEYNVANKLLGIKNDSLDKRFALLELAAAHEIDLIERTNVTEQSKIEQENAVELKLKKDKADASLEIQLKQIDLDKQLAVNSINEAKVFATQNTSIQYLKNLALLNADKDAAQKRLDALKEQGSAVTAEVLAQAQAQLDAANNAIAKAVANKPPKSILELFLPDASDAQLANITSNITQAFTSIGQAIDSYSKLVQDRYQKIIDAKKAAVAVDDEAINSLQDQLKTEEELRLKGYASNINGVNAQLAAQVAQRAKDLSDQENYQKAMEKSQHAQAAAQTALQSANLITAATNIYLQATAVGGPLAVPIAIAAIAAMIAAFAFSKIEAAQAVNTTQFADGGEITGKSHAQGGQKYFAPDSSGGVMELEEGEYVTNRKATEKYKPLLEVINNNSLDKMSEVKIAEMLAGLGVHLDPSGEMEETLNEARLHTTNNIISLTTPKQGTPKELIAMSANMRKLVKQNDERVEVYEEGGYIVQKKGNTKIKRSKK